MRVNELLRKGLADVFLLTDIEDPALAGATITVTGVNVSPDLRNAAVFVLPLGGDAADEALAALQRHRRFLRGQLARRVSLKHMPDLTFKLDTSFDQSDRVEEILRSPKVARDIG